MAEQDIRILQSLAAQVAHSADRYAATASAAENPRLVTPLNDRAAERRRAAAALDETARELGAADGHPDNVAARVADGIRAAFTGRGDEAALAALLAMEDELQAAFDAAAADELDPRTTGEIGAIAGSLSAARAELAAAIDAGRSAA